MTEKHIENIVKMMGQLRCAYNAYKVGNTGTEVYFMVRAEAYADALGISHDEFLDYKMMVEKENEMVDTLMMPIECINSINDMDRQIRELESEVIYTVTYADIYDNDFTTKTFRNDDSKAREYFADRVKNYFDIDERLRDSYGNKFEECLENGQAFFEDNGNHGDIYIWLTKEKVQ